MNRNKNYEKYLKPLSLLLITYWLFSNALNTIFPFFGKLPIDEIVYTIITVSIFRKLVVRTVKIDKKEKIIIIIYFVFIFTGWVSYVLNGQQSLQSVVLDIILLSRFIVCYFFARMCFSEGFFMDLQHSLNKLAQIITVGLFLSLILNFVIRIWPTNSIRLGIETQQLFFSHPTYLTSVAVFCLIVFYMNRNSKNYVFITLAAVIVIFGTRDKGFLFLGIYLVLLILSKIGIKSNITFLLVSTISLIPIFWDTIAYKLISSDTSARSLLYKNALQIANLYLPIGAGFAMYGSNQSIKNYSPIYNELGMNKIFGFTMENPNYLTDSFIAMVLGQFGYIGIILMIVIFLFFLLLVKGNKLRNEFGLLILIYVITSTITENFISSSFGMAFFFTLGLSINSGTEKDYGGEDKKMQDMINFEKMYKIVMAKKKLLLTLLFAMTVAGMTLTIFGIKGEYKSTVQVIVRQNFEGETIQNTEVQANVQLVNTYNEIIKSPFILEKVSDQIDKKFDVLQLRRMIKVTNATNSQVINISILANNPKTSSELANLVAETFKDNAAKAIKIDSVTILSKSEYDTVSTRKKKSVYFLIVFSLSLLILVGIVILIAVSDTTLKVEEDIINGLNLAVLGSVVKIVPREPEKKEKRGKDGRRRRKKS